ncbi:adenylate/guanylate cyclase domain-containing protein [Mycobacterium sp.]|uniref:adenylate/guanylate cyclase domain-containing protein n=1 Tax=Mycobacterium sp. TaxID=1785 RepID=UPI002D5E3593|nr:adenylate/guanylate cyclase domain-containing protein [Mycobacterium sp.]HZA09827.1 adenylate/guanylate cyclase domain-containing protein [Mycobacterium sp.]
MAAELDGTASEQPPLFRRSYCGPPPRLAIRQPARIRHYLESIRRRRRVIDITTYLAAIVSVTFSVLQLVTPSGLWEVAVINFVAALIFVAVPLLHRFGPLVPSLTLILTSYASLSVVTWTVGTSSGLQFYYLVAATIVLLVIGTDHMVIASILAATGAAIVIALQFLVPADTGAQPGWAITLGFVINVIAAWGMVLATVSYALREIARAEDAMDQEYERSESLLENILPGSIAARLKNPSATIIADRYADASILFADIAGYTERASDMTPADLVEFLNRLYTDFDQLVERHGLEKIKTSGDCYIVVSGVPEPRPDHLEALACLAINMRDTVDGLIDPRGREVPLRMGIGAGPLVAGVVGTRRFFYDVWGDAVNVASRMESTGVEGKIQIPHDLYRRLDPEFVLEERGEVTVKGKGKMRTWFLVEQRDLDGNGAADQPVRSEVSVASRSTSADVT